MYVAKDKSGTFVFSEEKPERMDCHWKTSNKHYFVCNQSFGEKLFPEMKWEDEPMLVPIIIDKNIL